jgi:predicted nucleic acid-binding protein
MDAFDADVLIYAAVPGHPLGEQVAALFRSVAPATSAGLGSVLLLPEVLGRPLRDGAIDEVRILAALLARLDLRPVDRATAELATALSSRYQLKAADATHLATAVGISAETLDAIAWDVSAETFRSAPGTGHTRSVGSCGRSGLRLDSPGW